MPEKRRKGTCADCGGECDHRAVRCARCYGCRGTKSGWRVARRLYPVEGALCENGCGRPAYEHHHLDGDQHHNDRSNVLLVCRRCHMALDGRLHSAHPRVRGEAHPRAKLTAEQIAEARRLKTAGQTQRSLASRFGVCESTLSMALRGVNWKHLAQPKGAEQ